MTALRLLALLALTARVLPPAAAQDFGQNQVVRQDLEWRVASTAHFDIHYYDGSAAWVPRAAFFLERAYERLSRALNQTFDERVPFFLYANVNDFQQSTIAETGDGTGGVTEAFKDRFMVYCDGTEEWLEDVIVHELVHVFQFKILHGGFWKSIRIVKTIFYPLWLVEGMAEYFTEGLNLYNEDMVLRDLATSPQGLTPLEKLQNFAHLKPHQITPAYKEGSAALKFMAREYGPERVEQTLRVFAGRFEANSVLLDVLGLDLAAFDRKFREQRTREYEREVREKGLEEPARFGAALTTPNDDIPQFNVSPVFAPDGRWMAYLTTRGGHPPEVHLKDLKTGRKRVLVGKEYSRIEDLPLGNFGQHSRNLALSPDGRRLAFPVRKNHVDTLALYDLRLRRLERRELAGFMTIGQPAFSPDGAQIAFSGMQGGFTDLWLYDLKTRALKPLTQDPQDDQSPAFSPDGRWVAWSSEVVGEGDDAHQRGLYLMRLTDGSVRRLPRLQGRSRDPVFSADGKRILFVNDGTGTLEVYEATVETGSVRRLTRSIGGNFTPAYLPGDGGVAFAAYRHGGIHVYAGPRERFLDEPAATLDSRPAAVVPSTAPAAVLLTPERPYRFRASTDLFLPAFFFSSPGGLFWTSYWQASDMLGRHTVSNFINYNSGAPYLRYQLGYRYARFRPEVFFAADGLQVTNDLDPSTGLDFEEEAHKGTVGVRYPFDRFHRMELALSAEAHRIRYPDIPATFEAQFRTASAALVRDTVSGRYLVPLQGSRLRAEVETNRRVLGGTEDSDKVSIEAHQFIPVGSQSTLGLRLFGAQNGGGNARITRIGGLGGVRGTHRGDLRLVGLYTSLVNAEYRFPVVRDLDYNLRLVPDLYFKAVYGAVFTDTGFAWDSGAAVRRARLEDAENAVGVGLRVHTFILQAFPLVITLDWAKRTTARENILYLYVGPLF